MEAELESLKEENYRLKLKLSALEQSSSTEIEYLKEEVQSKEIETKELVEKIKSDAKQRETELIQRINGINEELHSCLKEKSSLEEELSLLKKSFDNLKSVQSNHYSRSDKAEILKVSNDHLQIQLKARDDALGELQTRYDEADSNCKELKNEQVALRESLENAETCIVELQKRLEETEQRYQEELVLMQQNFLHSQSDLSCNFNKRGNSLFSEVDERREKVEVELKRQRERIEMLVKENIELSETLERGDCRKGMISEQLQKIEKAENEALIAFKSLKSDSRRFYDSTRDRLTALREEYTKKLLQYQNATNLNFSKTEIEKLREEKDDLLLKKFNLELGFSEAKKDIENLKRQLKTSQAKEKIARLKSRDYLEKLKALENKCGLNLSSEAIKNGGNISLSPGSLNCRYFEGSGSTDDAVLRKEVEEYREGVLTESKKPNIGSTESTHIKGTSNLSSNSIQKSTNESPLRKYKKEEMADCITQ